MGPPEPSADNPEDESDLSARVEALERALTEQADTLRELRAEVQRLRAAVDVPPEPSPPDARAAEDDASPSSPPSSSEAEESEAEDTEPDSASPTPEEAERTERDTAPKEDESDTDEVDGAPEDRPARPPSDEPPSTPSERPQTADRPLESGTSSSAEVSDAGATAPAASSDEADASSSPSESEALLDRLVTWAGLRSEDWLNYVGIGLLLFGVLFLLRYSIEQGWLIPTVRVSFGAVLGGGLLGAGLRLSPARKRLRQVLLGGSSGTFYATIFAAYQFYSLLPYPVAFASMAVVTVGTVTLAIRQDEPILSIIGVLGGLGTPFLLYNQAGSLAGFSLYTCMVLLGACAVFVWRGWRSLLYTTVAGGWTVFFITVARTVGTESLPDDAWALQGGIGIAWLLLAGTPVLRALLRRRAPDQWPVVHVPDWMRPLARTSRPAYGLVTVSPFVAFTCTRLLWNASDQTWALLAGAGALIYGGAYVGLRRVSLSKYAPVHALVAAVMAAYGLSKALGGAALLVAWSVEAFLLMGLADRLGERIFRRSGHALFAVVAVRLTIRLLDTAPTAMPLVRPDALSELVALSMVGAASLFVRVRWRRWTYRGAALAGWLAWIAGELWFVANGPHYVLLVWAGTGTAMGVTAPHVDDDTPLRIATNVVFAGAGVLYLRLAMPALAHSASVRPALLRLGGLGLAFWAARYAMPLRTRTIYRGVVLGGWLVWLPGVLLSLTHGATYLLVAWAGTGAALAFAVPYVEEPRAVPRTAVHLIYALVGTFMAVRLLDAEPAAPPILNVPALGELLVLGLAVFVSRLVDRTPDRQLYRGAVLGGWLAWLLSVLLSLPHGATYVLVAWAGTGAALAFAAPSLKEAVSLSRSAVHLIYVLVGTFMAVRFLDAQPAARPILNVPALGELLVLGLAVFVSRLVDRTLIRRLYRSAVLVGWLAWTAHEMALLPNGQAYTSLLWGTTAAALLLSGARYDRRAWQIGGLVTLAVFVAKLFLVDLASLPPLWRIALFLGFGAAFLAASYFLPNLIPAPASGSDGADG